MNIPHLALARPAISASAELLTAPNRTETLAGRSDGRQRNACAVLRIVVYLQMSLRHVTIGLRLFNVTYPIRSFRMSQRANKSPMNFKTMSQVDVPQGRNGKHKEVVTQIFSDLDQLPNGIALKVPLAELAESKEKVRSALNRAIHKGARKVATASDADFLYVWNEAE
jgi:hypothetical protein